jgi:hypothetical protein
MGIILHVHTKIFNNFMSTWYILSACMNDCTMSDISTCMNMAQEQTIKHHRLCFLETSLIFITVTFPTYYTDVTHIGIPDCNACPHFEHKFHTIKHAVHILTKELTNSLTNYMGLSPSWKANISSANQNKKSQELTNCLYPDPDELHPCPPNLHLKDTF